ncbi:MAG: hypothetical protein EA392_11850 [Cryomorphaceae bacterium]|nr:MAG: hypothetical protein EA392_11850 [Cryomorphaceae bacterium]
MKNLMLIVCVSLIGTSAIAQIEILERPGLSDSERFYSTNHLAQSEIRDGFIVEDGKMLIIENRTSLALKRETTLDNGTVVSVNGNYTVKGEKPVMLKEDEHLDMDGVLTKRYSRTEPKKN